MSELFLKILEMSLTGSFIIFGVILTRLIGAIPRRYICALWLIAALRLLLPWLPESGMSMYDPSTLELPQTAFEQLQPPIDAPEAPESAAPGRSALDAELICSYVWLGGTACIAAYGAITYIRLRRRTALAVKSGEDGVWECCECASPFIMGFLRPRIILPPGLEGERRELILRHERAHIAAHDQLKKPLAYLVLALHWFNPLVWLAYGLFCRDLELACDERVVDKLDTDGRKAYSHALLDFSERERTLACPLAFGELDIRNRVHRVLCFSRPAKAVIAVCLLAAGYWAVTMLTNPPAEEEDLSLLNYRQAANVAYQAEMLPAQVWNGVEWDAKQVPGEALGSFLSKADWEVSTVDPDNMPALKMIVELSGDFKLELYAIDSFRARLTINDEERWYAIEPGDYQDLVATAVYPIVAGFDLSQWDDGEFTAGVPRPDFGEVEWSQYVERDNVRGVWMSFSGVSREQVLDYIGSLNDAGFETIELIEEDTVSSSPQLSTNALLMRGEQAVSISHIGDSCGMLISTQK